jgi:hypothetical protein
MLKHVGQRVNEFLLKVWILHYFLLLWKIMVNINHKKKTEKLHKTKLLHFVT